ncbi:MAG: hypothetical protein K9N09_10860 [Candidatus Cloacimonetes bacterium]|nr:hypothetical protein [Candidatus Cloacimonadota bacterium]MCF7869186.1 hypothetical protein [Candidatus Cloacimonadota bacterium]
MRKWICIFLLVFPILIFAQNLLNQPESVEFNNHSNSWLVSNKATGEIVEIDMNGDQAYFAQGYGSIRGITVYEDELYTAGDNGVVIFDLDNSSLLMTLPIPGASFINDIICYSGYCYVSDPGSGNIFKIDLSTLNAVVFSSAVPTPNGLWIDDDNLLVCSWTSGDVYSLDLGTAQSSLLKQTGHTELDGITQDSEGNYYVSSWGSGAVIKYDDQFSGNGEIVSSGHAGPADIFYFDVFDQIAIPEFNSNSIAFLDLTSNDGAFFMIEKPELYQNYPNPFNPSTTISFNVTQTSSFVALEIYNIRGQIVKTLVPSSCHPELVEGRGTIISNSVVWNGTDDSGKPISSGVYFYRLKAGEASLTKKMLLLR